ncbi:MAG: MerR family DNA-binding transcriptional regulator [Pseudomonadota bacterium]
MTQSNQTFSIGEIAREFELTPRSIRFYEEQGLIHPSREGMTRVYSHKDKVRLKLILRGKRLGFSLAEIRNLFDLYDTNPNSAEQLKTLLHLTKTKREVLQLQLNDINMLMAELNDVEARCKEELDALTSEQRGTK